MHRLLYIHVFLPYFQSFVKLISDRDLLIAIDRIYIILFTTASLFLLPRSLMQPITASVVAVMCSHPFSSRLWVAHLAGSLHLLISTSHQDDSRLPMVAVSDALLQSPLPGSALAVNRTRWYLLCGNLTSYSWVVNYLHLQLWKDFPGT